MKLMSVDFDGSGKYSTILIFLENQVHKQSLHYPGGISGKGWKP